MKKFKFYISKVDYEIIIKSRITLPDGRTEYVTEDDFVFGDVGEKLIIQYFIFLGFTPLRRSKRREGDLEFFDVIFQREGEILTVEVKFDKFTALGGYRVVPTLGRCNIRTEDSGNIYLESSKNIFQYDERGRVYDDNLRPVILENPISGVFKSQSDFFITIILGVVQQVWIKSTKDLKKLIEDNMDNLKFSTLNGQNQNSNGYLMNRDAFNHEFEIFDYEFEIVDEYTEELKSIYDRLGY